jgi:hypothetical protein
MAKIYIVFEGGGIETDPKVHGIFENRWLAKECLKSTVQQFLDDNMIPVFDEENAPLIDKRQDGNYTYFYIYQDAEEKEFNSYLNVFVFAEIENQIIKKPWGDTNGQVKSRST